MFERFTADARATVVAAQAEAHRLAHHYLGTEHLLLGLVVDTHTPAGSALARLGLTLEVVRGEVLRIIGPGARLDGSALASIGIDLDEVRRHVEAAFGPGALDSARPGCRPGQLPFTPRAKKVLELAVREAAARGDGRIGGEHVLLALLREGEGVAAQILARHAIGRPAVEAELRRAA
jgi:ATP-dependent Clp protease ATP-binding subunit ClpA